MNLAWLGAQIRRRSATARRYGVRIHYSDEGPEPLETGGGIFRALPLLGAGPFLVLNGDVWTDIDYGGVARAAGAAEILRTSCWCRIRHTTRRATSCSSAAASSRRRASGCTFSGVGVYRAELFAAAATASSSSRRCCGRAARAGRVSGEMHAGAWLDIGTPERLANSMPASARQR